MNNRKHIIIVIIFFVLLVNISAANYEIELQERYDQKVSSKLEVYNKTLKFIENNPDSPGLAKLYYNLAEMSTEINVNNPAIIAGYYGKILQYDPNFILLDAVLYNRGYYLTESKLEDRDLKRQNNIDLAINWPDSLRINEENMQQVIISYERIKSDFPESKYYSEATYRLGNLYFEIAIDAKIPREYFDKAIGYYNELSKIDGDPLQYHGLFQEGWAYFASARFEKAIDKFTKILEVIETDSAENFKAYFEADAIENIAYSLIEYDGTDFEQHSEAAKKAIEIFQNYSNDKYVKNIIINAVQLKQKYNAPMQAIDMYNSYLAIYPTVLDAPTIIDSIMTIYKRNASRTRDNFPVEDLVIKEIKRITSDYNSNSKWYLINNVDSIDLKPQLEIVKYAFEFLEPNYYNNYVRTKRYDDYLAYRDLIGEYSDFTEFSDSLSLAKKKNMQFNVVNISQEIAEANNNPYDYFVAIDNIVKFDDFYENHNQLSKFKEMKFSDYEQIFTLLQDSVKVATYNIEKLNMSIDKNSLDSLYMQASKEYQDYLIHSDYDGDNRLEALSRIIYQRADYNYSEGNLDVAFDDFSQLLVVAKNDTIATENNLQKLALSNLAEISKDRGDYSTSEDYYREASKYATTDEQENYKNNILSQIQAKANTLADSSDYITAATEYLRLSEELVSDDLPRSLAFKAKAIENYKLANENQKVIDLLMEMALTKTDKNDILNIFVNAWSITDTLGDYSQSELLRRMFIDKFPASNEAYRLRIQVIDFYENEPYHNKMEAAEMYLILHEDAANIDIGDASRASIFLKAISIYQEANMEDEIVKLMLEFEELYPDNENSNDFLTKVALIYNQNEETEKFEDLARKIYRKDPSIDLLSSIVAEKLKKMNSEVATFFEEKNYEQMFVKIEEFKAMAKDYENDGLFLPLDSSYEAFNYYQDYIDYYQQFDEKIASITQDFLDASPAELIRVNINTKWKEHLFKGKRRVGKLSKKCVSYREEIISLITAGNSYNIPIEKRTEALYLSGRIFEYGYEVVLAQVQKYLDVSNQMNREEIVANPVLQKQFKDQIYSEGRKRANELKLEAAKMYNAMMTTFVDDKEYSDLYTDLAYQKLVDWKVRNPKIFVNSYSNLSWNILDDTGIDPIWNNVSIDSVATLLDSASVVILPPAETNIVMNNFYIDYLPELVTIEYIANDSAKIYLNGELVHKKAKKKDDVEFDGFTLTKYLVILATNLHIGENEITMEFVGDSLNTEYMAALIKFQYDEEKLMFAKTTEQRKLLSGYTWNSIMKDNYSIDDIQASLNDLDSTRVILDWKESGEANLLYYKNQIYGMENTEAQEIWHAEIDTTKVETVYFLNEFVLTEEVISANASYIGQNIASIWVNGILVADKVESLFDTKLLKADSKSVEINNLIVGKNQIVVEVIGGKKYKGFIYDMDYIVRKK